MWMVTMLKFMFTFIIMENQNMCVLNKLLLFVKTSATCKCIILQTKQPNEPYNVCMFLWDYTSLRKIVSQIPFQNLK